MTLQVAFAPLFIFTVMVAVPALIPFTTPFLDTVAIFLSLVEYWETLSVLSVLDLIASFVVLPTLMVALVFLRVMLAGTVTLQVAFLPFV